LPKGHPRTGKTFGICRSTWKCRMWVDVRLLYMPDSTGYQKGCRQRYHKQHQGRILSEKLKRFGCKPKAIVRNSEGWDKL